MLDEPQNVADLEAEIEALRDEADRSRKLTILAKLVIVAGAVMLPVSFLVSSPTALVMAPPVHSLPWYAVTKSDPRTRNSLSLGQALAYEPDDFRTLGQRVA